MWQGALEGAQTVKSARQQKDPSGRPEPKPRTMVSLKTDQASVTVAFAKGEASPQDVVEAQTQALLEAKVAVRLGWQDPAS